MTTLTTTEAAQLETCEMTIKQGLETFYEVGNALLTIRDGRLYRANFDTFEEYCRTRWNISRSRAHRLIEAAGVADNLLPMGNIPTNERQARELSPLNAETQQIVWEYAAKSAPVVDGGPQITAAHIRRAAYTVRLLQRHGWKGSFTESPVLLIDEEFHAVMPDCDAELRAAMEQSILKHGVINPLDVWGNIILDGHERYFICLRLGLPFEVCQRSFENRDAALIFIYESQLMRKNYTPEELERINSSLAA
jgi:hypothetical protein